MSQSKNILIVGGAGYIGSHTTLALKDAGYGTIVYDNFSTGHRDAVFSDHLVEGDLSDTGRLRETLRAYDIAPKDRTMHWFRRMHSLQKFASIHAPFHNLFNSQRSLSERCPFKLNCDAALNKWHSLVSP